MKSILSLSLCLFAFLLFTPNASAVTSALPGKAVEKSAVERSAVKKELTRKEKREMRKEIKTTLILERMLPAHAIEELRSGVDFVFDKHDLVSVLFCHVDKFDVHANSMTADDVVTLLNHMFSIFVDNTQVVISWNGYVYEYVRICERVCLP